MLLGFTCGNAETVMKLFNFDQNETHTHMHLGSTWISHVLVPAQPGDSDSKPISEFDFKHSQNGAACAKIPPWVLVCSGIAPGSMFLGQETAVWPCQYSMEPTEFLI
jgi:hypothetical protein